jgi:hypothetical protein
MEAESLYRTSLPVSPARRRHIPEDCNHFPPRERHITHVSVKLGDATDMGRASSVEAVSGLCSRGVRVGFPVKTVHFCPYRSDRVWIPPKGTGGYLFGNKTARP